MNMQKIVDAVDEAAVLAFEKRFDSPEDMGYWSALADVLALLRREGFNPTRPDGYYEGMLRELARYAPIVFIDDNFSQTHLEA